MEKIRVCKDCEDRYPACHDSCEKYKEAKERLQEQKDLVYRNSRKDAIYMDYRHKKFRRRGGQP